MPPRPVILCAGALQHEVIVATEALPGPGAVTSGQNVRFALGGRGGRQALAASASGAEVSMAGAVGSDDLAIALRAVLDGAGVRRGLVQTHPGPSGVTVRLEASGGAAEVVVPGANPAFRPEAVNFPKGCAALMLQCDLPEATNLALAMRARAVGVRIVLHLSQRADAALVAACDLVLASPGAAAGGVPVITIPDAASDALVGALVADWARGADPVTALAFGAAAERLLAPRPVEDWSRVDEAAIRAAL